MDIFKTFVFMKLLKMEKFLVLFLIIACTHALSDEQLKTELSKLIVKCLVDHPVDVGDLMNLQKMVLPNKPEVHCLLACAYKKQGLINEKGLYDIEQAYKVADVAKNGDEKRHENAKKFAEACSMINDAKVSDGEKGCERSALLFQCGIDNAPKLGFKL